MTILRFVVQPRAGKTEVVGWYGGAIKVRIKAPPVDGAANKELIRFLAKILKIRQTSIKIASGKASRKKRVAFEEMSREEIVEVLVGT